MLVVFLFILPMLASADNQCAVSPSEALRHLRQAYIEKDVEKAASSFNFEAWAQISGNQNLRAVDINRARESFKKRLLKRGFTDYSQLDCKATVKQIEKLAKDFVIVEDRCQRKGGGVSYNYSLIAVKTDCGWELAGPYKKK